MNPKSRLSVLYAKSVIEVNTTFAKMMQNPLSDEYALLQKVKAENEGFTVRTRQIKSNPKKDTYKGLTYEYMRDYIITHTSPEEELAAVAEFDEMILVSKCHGKSLRYPTIKKWFLAKYPEVAKFGAIEAEDKSQKEEQTDEAKSQNVIPMNPATQAPELATA